MKQIVLNEKELVDAIATMSKESGASRTWILEQMVKDWFKRNQGMKMVPMLGKIDCTQ